MNGATVKGLHVVYRAERKPVRSVVPAMALGVREATTGRPIAVGPVDVLRKVWAVADSAWAGAEAGPQAVQRAQRVQQVQPQPEMAFYRKYTEAMLRRYLRMSMGAGRTPSLLGRELFRAKVTSYRVHSFEDVVIFCHDMETCLGKLPAADKELIKRIGLQEYSQMEVAGMLRMSQRAVSTRYNAALDRLTSSLLEAKLLEPLPAAKAVKPLHGLSS
jgi:hypothetical protein